MSPAGADTRPRARDRPAPARPSVRDLLERPLTSYYVVLGATVMLCVLGLVMVLSASSVTSLENDEPWFSVFSRQLMWCAAGTPMLWVASRLPVVTVRRLAYLALGATLLLLVLTQVPGVGVSVNGNRNWIDVGGPFRLQPSELAKLALVIWGADLLTRKRRLLGEWKHLLVPLLPVAALVLGLVLMGRDLGTSLVLMAITGGLLFFAGAPMRIFVALAGLALALVTWLSVSSDNRRGRLLSFLNPSADLQGTGYQLLHSKYALGSGGWFGLGLGASREKWSWLPEQQTDFIFAVIGEELGLLGTVVVLALFAALAYGGFRIALRTRDPFVRLAASGITVWITVQTMVNIGAVLGVLPITGIPLPLVSYGGSALLPTMVALGLLLSFARQERGAAEALAARGPGPLRRITDRGRSVLPAPAEVAGAGRRRRTGPGRAR